MRFPGYRVLPGLINAHDHLEFNLFPRLGAGPYANASAWAADIYRPGESPVREQRRVPLAVRLYWGGLKNLLSGVTTVAHHDAFSGAVFTPDFPVRVVARQGWAHSLAFAPDVVERFRATPAGAPFVIHAAEGTDAAAAAEIGRLDALGVLDERTVLVHGVAASCADLALLRARGCSLVWCPSSNLFTLGRTLSREALGCGVPVVLGSDSALTAAGDLLDEMRVARTMASAEEVYEMVTARAAAVLRLEERADDWVVVKDVRGEVPRPEMVIIGGRVRLLSMEFAARHREFVRERMHPLAVEGLGRWLVDVDVPALYGAAAEALGGPVRLAGRFVTI